MNSTRMTGIQVKKINTFVGHKDSVYTLEPAKGQSAFFSGSGDGMVVKWNFDEPDKGHLVANLSNSVYALEYLDHSNRLIIGQNFQGIHCIDVANNKEVGSLSLTNSAIFDIKHIGNRLLVATGEGKVYLIDVEKLKIVINRTE